MAVLEGDPRTIALAYWPVPTLAVVGEGLIAEALEGAAALLGWTVRAGRLMWMTRWRPRANCGPATRSSC